MRFVTQAMTFGALTSLLGLLVCGCGPSAMGTCHELEAAGVAKNCRAGTPRSDSPLADAVQCADFDMISGGRGQVYLFESEVTFNAVLTAQREQELAKFIARSDHGVTMQQGYVKARTIVVLGQGATQSDEDATRVVLGQEPVHQKP